MTSKLAASSSSGLSINASWSDEWFHHLALVGDAGVLNIVGGEAVDGGSLPAGASCGVVASMVVSGTMPVRSCKEYISTHGFQRDKPARLCCRPP